MADHLLSSTRKLLQSINDAKSNSERRRLMSQLEVDNKKPIYNRMEG